MAKRRMTAKQLMYFGKRKKSRSRRSTSSGRKSRRSGLSSNAGLIGQALGAMLYGAGRERVSMALQPLTSKVPLGVVADEVVMGSLSYGLASGKIPVLNKIPYSREIGKAGLAIEFARIGQAVADGSLIASLKGTSTTTQSTQGLLF